MATRKLRFRIDRGFGSMQVRAGAVVDVPEFWAQRCIADGSAVEVEETPIAKPEPKTETEPEAAAAEPVRKQTPKKRPGKKNA